MVRKSLVAMATALSLVTATAQAAPARVASPMSASEALDDDQAWVVPMIAILAVILIVLLDKDRDSEDPQANPVSP